ncbi:MAG TPA: hypothetical protein VJY15_10785, partial [Candidatus Acidoferrum sp.]|nr:hypothetical protein [Candidatus Acidoferrum sp.]
ETSLAALKIRRNQFQEAIEHIGKPDNAISHLLMSHSYAALGRFDDARRESAAVNDNSFPPLVELRDEIAARFGLVEYPPKRGEAWLLDYETEVILQAA